MLTERQIARALSAPLDAVVPVTCELTADTETPVSAFLKLRRGGTAFLLESGERDGRLGRYSFIGATPEAVLRAALDRGTVTTESEVRAYRGSPLDAVREFAGTATVVRQEPADDGEPPLPRFLGGLVGAFGFDLVRSLERLPTVLPDDTGFPAAIFARYHTVLAFDHLRQRLLGISLLPPAGAVAERKAGLARAAARLEAVVDALRRGAAPAAALAPRVGRPPAMQAVPDDHRFRAAVAEVREQIRAGEAIQVVLSRRLDTAFDGDPFDVYRALRTVSPTPYMFYLEFPEVALAGCSPEMLLRIEGEDAQVSPIAGTRPRGGDAAADTANEADLLADAKERAEHVMLVDLGRNDLGRVCRPGTVTVSQLMEAERFSHVMHLVSVVTGRLREGVDALEAFAACFPAGTVSGAPRVRALQLIEELETIRRGSYAGAIANIAPGARELDACITIRTAVVRRGRLSVQVGAGIVADSVPERELAETNAKARAMLAALALLPSPTAAAVLPHHEAPEAVA